MEVQTTSVFEKSLVAYHQNKRIIINKGGTRSSKTYSVLQLLFILALYSEKRLVISVVSYALPHLKLGAMRDLDKIILSFGMIPAKLKNVSESTYKVGESIIEFFGVDNLGKVHGPERDILFINEGNYIKSYDIVRQLMVRTRNNIFIDYNPSREFWVDDEIIGKRECEVITSTYLDNEFLTLEQINEIESNKHNEQWWRVYGLGLQGRLEDTIFNNWELGEFNNALPYGYGLDFGVKDPDALIKAAVDKRNNTIYFKEELYKVGNSTEQLTDLVKSRGVGDKLIIAESASPRTITDLRTKGLNVRAVIKGMIVDDIKMLWNYKLIIDPESHNLVKELNNYTWMDKKGEIPIDEFNHLLDAARYYTRTVIKPKTSKGHRIL